MKTIKWLKISIILHGIFAFFAIASTVCFAINSFFDLEVFFTLGIFLVYGWIINPIGTIASAVGLVLFCSERKNEESRKMIGKKWTFFIMLWLIDVFLYLMAGLLTVFFTGGV